MTPSKKATELYEMFYFAPDEDGFYSQNKYRAKVQAILCCNEIIKEYGTYYKIPVKGKYLSYWEEVKREIELL